MPFAAAGAMMVWSNCWAARHDERHRIRHRHRPAGAFVAGIGSRRSGRAVLDVYLAWFGAAAQPAAVGLARRLRDAGFVVELPAVEMKFGKSLGLADRLKARHAVILGEDELAAGVVAVKRLADGTQQKLAEPELFSYLRDGAAMLLSSTGCQAV